MSENSLTLPFAIGETWWLAVGDPHLVTLPCPVCAGQLAVTVILGSGEHVGVACEACGIGFESPKGTIDQWEHTPKAGKFVIASVDSFYRREDQTCWTLRSETGGVADFTDLHATEAEALAVATKKAADWQEENLRRRAHMKKSVKSAAWAVRYHREQIRDLERSIAWHQSKIQSLRPTEAA